ncbi:MAG: hypothetical protein, partial [Olavius algarvensis Gamma 3 endosymbiont]
RLKVFLGRTFKSSPNRVFVYMLQCPEIKLLLMGLFVKPGHCNTFKYTNLIYSGQQCAQAGILQWWRFMRPPAYTGMAN